MRIDIVGPSLGENPPNPAKTEESSGPTVSKLLTAGAECVECLLDFEDVDTSLVLLLLSDLENIGALLLLRLLSRESFYFNKEKKDRNIATFEKKNERYLCEKFNI